ncbi:MAG: ABC transporter permease [Oscillospiraceae bacterium]|nr:ABC transporter permease [Oscillospiraceae bacterium]
MVGLYSRLAAVGIRKNGKSYAPYIMTCSLMIMIFYIVSYLGENPLLKTMPGGGGMALILSVGTVVMAIFSAIFLFYTNSFLIKRRKKEFGLYNILGLGKWQIARVLMIETLLVYAISMIAGLGFGILFSKLAEMLAARMLAANLSYTFSISWISVIAALIWFAIVFMAILLNSLRQLYFSKPIELLRSGNVGERPPRTNIPGAVIGAILLGIAYFIAIKVDNPEEAVPLFMLAVILVMIATFLLFIAGSVVLCRILQKNKRYYYQTGHFVSVSQMAYRMRRNGAGLASICILATMVLVTISSTTTLFIGISDYVKKNFPYDITATVYGGDKNTFEQYIKMFDEKVTELGYTPQNQSTKIYLTLRHDMVVENMGVPIPEDENDPNARYLQDACVYLLDDFDDVKSGIPELGEGEIAVYEPTTDFLKHAGTLKIKNGKEYKIVPVEHELTFDKDTYYASHGVSLYLFAKDADTVKEISRNQDDFYGEESSPFNLRFIYSFDATEGGTPTDELERLVAKLYEVPQIYDDELNMDGFHIGTQLSFREDMCGYYSGLFFLGVLMGGVFILSVALIMYYKQVSEGYEDVERFRILRKVGMSKREIKSTIGSQVLVTFFLPLISAGIHMLFAFPIVTQLLRMFDMTNTGLFALTTLGSYILFAMIYIIVYKTTSKSYNNIVSGE